jgi:hypothetical protein
VIEMTMVKMIHTHAPLNPSIYGLPKSVPVQANRVEWSGKLFQTGIVADFAGTLQLWQEHPDGSRKQDIAEAILRAVPDARKAEAEAVLKPVAE